MYANHRSILTGSARKVKKRCRLCVEEARVPLSHRSGDTAGSVYDVRTLEHREVLVEILLVSLCVVVTVPGMVIAVVVAVVRMRVLLGHCERYLLLVRGSASSL